MTALVTFWSLPVGAAFFVPGRTELWRKRSSRSAFCGWIGDRDFLLWTPVEPA